MRKKWDLSDLNGDYTASSVGLVPWRVLVSVLTKVIKIYWCDRRDTNQSESCLNPSGQNLSIRRFNEGKLYDLSRLRGMRGSALEAETLQWSCQQKHWCRVFPNNFRSLCQRRHFRNAYNLQVGVFNSMSKVWQQHICRQMKFQCCYHSEILLAATTGRHHRQLRAWPRIHVQPRFQRGFRNGVTFLRVVYTLSPLVPSSHPNLWSLIHSLHLYPHPIPTSGPSYSPSSNLCLQPTLTPVPWWSLPTHQLVPSANTNTRALMISPHSSTCTFSPH